MIGSRPTRAISIAAIVVLVLSGLGLFTAFAAGVQEEALDPVSSVEENAIIAKNIQPGATMQSLPLTRDEIRSWAESLGRPEMRLALSEEEMDVPFAGARGPALVTPADADENVIHKADLAQALGFDGTGVRVGIIDTGVDFAQPELWNRSARVMDAASPYFLHPIAYDAASMSDYLIFGEPASNSWWVNTSFNTTVEELGDGTRWVNWTDGTTNLSWNVTGVAGLPTGEPVRIGFHPDDKLVFLNGGRSGLVLFNYTGSGSPFDSVMADLDGDFDLGDEKRAYINPVLSPFDPEAELLYQDLDGDGIQDMSGGMLQFIADGVREIPYASGHVDALNFSFQTLFNDNSFDLWAAIGADPTVNFVPGDGNLTLLFGDFDSPISIGSHGTWVTSALAGQGRTGGPPVSPILSGQAPGAKIIGIGNNFGFFDIFFGTPDPFLQSLDASAIFATEGYDGIPGTGDEAHIASNSWGGFGYAGWHWWSRFVHYISVVLADERTLFVFSSGNEGPGYGSAARPAGSPGVVTSGAMDNWLHRDDPWNLFEGGPNPSYQDVTSFSNPGPSALGRHKVDALTNGRFGYGADPLNDNPFLSSSGTTLDGNSSWVLWGGTSLSAPNLSGILALIYDAYMAAHGGLPPLASDAKTILKNSNDDPRLDPFLAGSGIGNALRGVLIANETDGLSLDRDEWNPGDYRGVTYEAYANILPPGGADTAFVDMTNHRPAATMDVDVADYAVSLNGSISMSFTRVPATTAEQFILNGSGLFALNGTLLVPADPGLFATADFLRVSMWFDRSRLAEFAEYRMRLLDWTDADANGSFDGFAEENLMARSEVIDGTPGPNMFGYIQDPAGRIHDGLVIRLEVRDEATLVGPVDFDLQIDYYERTDFGWIEIVGPSSFTIAAASTATVELSVTVPGDAPIGLYEAVVLFKLDNGDVTTLPVVVNVAATGLPVSFGDPSQDSGVYQQGVQYGSYDGTSSGGDWRYYFLDLPEATTVSVLLEWDEETSSNDLRVLTNVTDWFTDTAPLIYGPGTQVEVAAVESGSNTTSLVASLSEGLSIIVVRSTVLAGLALEEHPRGQVGAFSWSPASLTGVGVPVEGEETFTITSQLAFPNLQSFIESGSVLVLLDQPVDVYPCTGVCSGDAFIQYLFDAPNLQRIDIGDTVTRVNYELFFHSGARDVDFGVFGDPDCDAVYVVDDFLTLAGTLANPEAAAVNNPTPGCHWVHVAGFDVDPGSLYDLTVTFVEAPVLAVTSLPSSIEAGVPADVTVAWDLPHVPSGVVGSIFFGSPTFPLALPLPFSLLPDLPPMLSGRTPTPDAVLPNDSPTISLDWQDTPDAFESAVDPDSLIFFLDGADFSGLAVATATGMSLSLPLALSQGQHTVFVEVHDETGSQNRTTWTFTVDSVAPSLTITEPVVSITNVPVVDVAGTTDPGVTVTVNGTPVSVGITGIFRVTLTLPDGTHSLPVVATDNAGNSASTTVDLIVDTVAPSITLVSLPTAVEVASVTVGGSTEAGASVNVNGVAVVVDATGAFSVNVALTPGSNTITAVATDAAGNSGSTSATVTFNDPVPGLQQDLDSANDGLNTAQDVAAALQLQLFAAIAIAVIGLVLAAVLFVLWWGSRRKA